MLNKSKKHFTYFFISKIFGALKSCYVRYGFKGPLKRLKKIVPHAAK